MSSMTGMSKLQTLLTKGEGENFMSFKLYQYKPPTAPYGHSPKEKEHP